MEAREAAEKLAGLSTDELFGQLFDTLITPMLDQQSLTADDIALLKSKLLDKKTQKLRDGYTEMYLSLFTADELTAMWEWNQSPVATKCRELTPQIALHGFQSGQEIAVEIIGEIESEGLGQFLGDDELGAKLQSAGMDFDVVLDDSLTDDDDESLGAELLEEIYPGDGKSA